jgi:hypothetical protein
MTQLFPRRKLVLIASCLADVLCLLVLVSVLRTNSFGQDNVVAYPRIVASVHLTNLTSDVPTTTIFTPTRNGLYRISVNMVVTVPGGNGAWTFFVSWADDAGAEEEQVTTLNSAPNASSPSASVAIFRANANKPVTYQTTGTPNADGSTYEVFFTVEQLQ